MYLSEPQSTECSRTWGTPVESFTGVRNTTPNTLLSSSACAEMISAPDFVCRYVAALIVYSSTMSTRTSSNAGCVAGSADTTDESDGFDSVALMHWFDTAERETPRAPDAKAREVTAGE